jgi:FkbM family methyltransferase
MKAVDRLCEHTYIPKLLHAGSIVFDFGANYGKFSHGMIARHECRVFAAEPVSELRAGIKPSPALTMLPFAVGGTKERAKVNIFGSRCASLLGRNGDESLDGEEDVEVLDLRSIFELSGVDRVDLMKVDIEGSEIGMFDTAKDEDLRRCTQITVEFHDFVYPAQGPQVEAIKKKLHSLGFWVINFSLDNTDVLFLNKATSGIGWLQYCRLKYLTKYSKGIARRFGPRGNSQASEGAGI